MKIAQCLSATSLVIAAFAVSATPPPSLSRRGETHQATATVESVDQATRIVQLKSENGPLSFVAGPEVRT
jgi:hypothetical protein